jgi:hypothetical protein
MKKLENMLDYNYNKERIGIDFVCYEHIKDTFYYGIFGDFKLVIDKNTGCFNATKLCEYGGKEFKFWKRLEKSKKMVEYYQVTPAFTKSNCKTTINLTNK